MATKTFCDVCGAETRRSGFVGESIKMMGADVWKDADPIAVGDPVSERLNLDLCLHCYSHLKGIIEHAMKRECWPLPNQDGIYFVEGGW